MVPEKSGYAKNINNNRLIISNKREFIIALVRKYKLTQIIIISQLISFHATDIDLKFFGYLVKDIGNRLVNC